MEKDQPRPQTETETKTETGIREGAEYRPPKPVPKEPPKPAVPPKK
jgi:hypothetical protein